MLEQQMQQFGDGFPIFFEGIELPRHTYCIDILAFDGIIPDVSEETRDWLWRFTICKGKLCECDSVTIVQCMNELLGLIRANKEQVKSRIEMRYEKRVDAEALLAEWLGTLYQLNEIAAAKPLCAWHGLDREKVD